MKEFNLTLKSITIFMMLLGFFACSTALDWDAAKQVDYSTSLIIPIGNAKATIIDFIKDDSTTIKFNASDSSLYIVWNDTSNIDFSIKDFSIGANGSYNFTPTTDDPNFTETGTVPAGKHLSFTQNINNYDLGLNENNSSRQITVDTIELNSGTMTINTTLQNIPVSSSNPLNANVSILDNNGNTIRSVNKSITSQSYNFSVDLGNLKIKFSNSNIIPIRIAYSYTTSSSFTIDDNVKIKADISSTTLDPLNIWGLFYDSNYFTEDHIHTEMSVDFINSFLSNGYNLLFSNPQIDFTIKNNIGIPLIFKIDSIYTTDNEGNIERADFNGSTSYNLHTAKPAKIGEYTSATALFDKNNGGTNKLFRIKPVSINYIWAIGNDLSSGENAEGHFVQFPIKNEAVASVKIPLQLDETSYVTYNDTIKADLSDLQSNINNATSEDSIEKDVKELKIFLDILNKIPVTAIGNFTFLDENGLAVYTYSNFNIASADVNSDGMSTSASKQSITLTFTKDNIDKILRTKKIIISLKAQGKDDNSKIYIRANDYIYVNVGGYVQGEIKTSLD